MEFYNLVSFSGIFLLIGIAWIFSSQKKSINFKTVASGALLQIIFAAFIFLVPAGTKFFLGLNDVVLKILNSATAGISFLFGRLALSPGAVGPMGESSLGFILAFQALPTIIFFAAFIDILYFFGIMQIMIKTFSNIFTRLMKISGAESLAVSSNIFVGVESSLVIKPYLEKMTNSELFTILTSGMATVASSVMALYVFILQDKFPTIAGHLISASILSAPAAIVMSKILLPELDSPVTLGENIKFHQEKKDNIIEVIINGANNGLKLVVGISALLIAFLGLVELLDIILNYFGGVINTWFGLDMDWSLKGILGYIFYPFTLIIGIPYSDAAAISKVIGERLVITEVGSYQDLSLLIKKGLLNHPRSAIIATYALCGFAHIASLAIFTGGTASLAPSRIKDLSRVGPKALLAATMACLMTAAVAGTFFNSTSILLNK